MKLLFKNILKSITKHKVQSLSLFGLILFAAATFSGILNASKSVNDAYKNFTKQSNAHNFVMDVNASPIASTTTPIKTNTEYDFNCIYTDKCEYNPYDTTPPIPADKDKWKDHQFNYLGRFMMATQAAMAFQGYTIDLSYRDTREFYDSKNGWLFRTEQYNPYDNVDKVIITDGHAPVAPTVAYSDKDTKLESLEQVMVNPKWAKANGYKLNSVLSINSSKYLISGFAYSYDMTYPTFDKFNPIANTSKNTVIYTRYGVYENNSYGPNPPFVVNPNYTGHFAPQSLADRDQYVVGVVKDSKGKVVPTKNVAQLVSDSINIYRTLTPTILQKWATDNGYPADSILWKLFQANWWQNDSFNAPDKGVDLSQQFKSTDLTYLMFGSDDSHYSYFLRSNALTFAQRISFFVTLMFMLIFVSVAVFIIAIITKKRVDDDKQQIGVFKALGFKNYKIAFAYTTFPLAIAVVSILVGYIASTLIQFLVTSIFNGVFVISFTEFSFNIDTFLLSFVVIMTVIFAISWTSVIFYTKKVSTAELMNKKE